MSKKHYTAMAKTFAAILSDIDTKDNPKDVFDVMVLEIADLCAKENERFDRERFYQAVYHAK